MSKHFISCDWGSTNLRLALVDLEQLEILKSLKSDQGVIKIAEEQEQNREDAFQSIFNNLILEFKDQVDISSIPIILSGMISSSIGWHDLPFADLPFELSASNYKFLKEKNLYFLSGVKTSSNTMRGEETQIIGLLQNQALKQYQDSAYIILPGTHSKHCTIKDNQIVNFKSFMTGEIFNLLTSHGSVKHTVLNQAQKKDSDAFKDGVLLASKETFTACAFRVRANQLLGKYNLEENTAFLSGTLIGSELAAIETDCEIVLAAQESLLYFYQLAASTLGIKFDFIEPNLLELATIKGQAMFLKNQL